MRKQAGPLDWLFVKFFGGDVFMDDLLVLLHEQRDCPYR